MLLCFISIFSKLFVTSISRCGRLASVIRHPKSDTSKFEHTLWALKLAISYAQCGWCQYDPPNLPPAQKSATTNAASMRRGKTRKTVRFSKTMNHFLKMSVI